MKKNTYIGDLLNLQNFLIFFFISLWLSIDTNLVNLSQEYSSFLKSIFIKLRILLPYFFFILLIILYRKNIFNNNKQKFLLYICVLFFISQSFGLLTSDNSVLNFGYILSSFFLFFIFYISRNKLINIYKFLNISIFILTLVLILYGYNLLDWFYTSTTNRNLYGLWPHSLEDLTHLTNNLPRSSGLSRTALILFIYFSFKAVIKAEKNFIFYTIIFIFLTIIITLTQSRIVLLFYIGYMITYFLSISISNLIDVRKKIQLFILVFLLPFLVTGLSVQYKNKLVDILAFEDHYYEMGEMPYDTSNMIFEQISEQLDKNLYSPEIQVKRGREEIIRKMDPNSFSSQRFNDWNKIIINQKKIILGYGTMGDRFLINQTASSGFVYTYASSGIVGLFIYCVIFFRSLYVSSFFIFTSKFLVHDKNYRTLIASSLVLFILFRSIAETSFALFGIDFIIFFVSLFYLENKKDLSFAK